jgi:hypothetical protein
MNTAVLHRLRMFLLLMVGAAMMGCSSESMKDGDLSLVQTFSDKPRAGNVYLLRGWIGVWSTGIDQLGEEINALGVRANVYRCEQWQELATTILEKYKNQKITEPLVIVGHSWGADHALDLAHELEAAHIPIDLIVTLDPVTPPTVPANVKWCHNVFQTNGIWQPIPVFRGVPLEKEQGSAGLLENLNIRKDRTDLLEPNTDHYNIEKNPKIHRDVIAQIEKICPPRAQWVQMHPSYSPPVISPKLSGNASAKPSSAGRTFSTSNN